MARSKIQNLNSESKRGQRATHQCNGRVGVRDSWREERVSSIMVCLRSFTAVHRIPLRQAIPCRFEIGIWNFAPMWQHSYATCPGRRTCALSIQTNPRICSGAWTSRVLPHIQHRPRPLPMPLQRYPFREPKNYFHVHVAALGAGASSTNCCLFGTNVALL